MRKKIVAGNWKMNKTLAEATVLVDELITLTAAEVKNNAVVVLCTPFPYLLKVKDQAGKSGIQVGAQNCSEHESGAYTGETSAAMLKSMGIPYVIIGHSGRRR